MQRNHSSGFTIIELSIVMIIVGLVSSTMFYALNLYSRSTLIEHTKEAMGLSRSAVLEFYSYNNRYPCPANPTLGPSDALYGQEDCALTPTPGQRDTNEDGTNDNILIGALPFRTLLDLDGNEIISESLTIDGHGQKLRYAVTESLTNILTFNQTEGVIDVVDENDQSVLGAPETAHFVIVSSGDNGDGGYTREGQMVGNCTNSVPLNDPTLPAPTFKTTETENCDDVDGKFLSGLRNEQDRYYNDDKILVGMTQTSSHWQYTTPTSIINTNAGNVGFGIKEPQEKLHVLGDVKADKMQAEGFCSPTGSDEVCMPTRIIAGDEPSMKCATAGTAVTAIESNAVTDHCEKVFPADIPSAPVSFNKTCPTGEVIVGISNITGVICEPKP